MIVFVLVRVFVWLCVGGFAFVRVCVCFVFVCVLLCVHVCLACVC